MEKVHLSMQSILIKDFKIIFKKKAKKNLGIDSIYKLQMR